METRFYVLFEEGGKKFKSYYVVWKHARGERTYKNPINSLNRTMQYGN